MEALAKLARFYGPLRESEPSDPFELVVWENVAYLVDDARRRAAFDALRREIGIEPHTLLKAGARSIERAIVDGGMLPRRRAEKVMRCAQIAMESAGGNLREALLGIEPKRARALLRRFPGIGEPGADKVMLLAGLARDPTLDSNGVRVLERLGCIAPASSYARTYQSAVEYLRNHGVRTARVARTAFERLRQHGRMLCKRAKPRCKECPLLPQCVYGRSRDSSP